MAEAKLNRAQLQAMEVRAAETLTPDLQAAAVAEVEEGSAAPLAMARRAALATKRAVARPIVLTKEQEYRFIRADLRRLGITAGSLFILMIALLFVVD
jgi:hypothetical protein